MKALAPTETCLEGSRILNGRHVTQKDVSDRIKWLTSSALERVAISPEYGAWEVLYRDPADGRFWELTYPLSAMHGGGPPQLAVVELTSVSERYGLPQPSEQPPKSTTQTS